MSTCPRDPQLARGDGAGRAPAPGWVQPVPAGVKQLPPLTTSPRWAPGPIPAEAEQKKGPLIAGGGLRSEGCYSRALRCVPVGHGALHAGACFSWPGMCSALLASAGRGGLHWGLLLPAGPPPCAKQGFLQAHLLHSCGEEGEMGDLSQVHLMALPCWGHISPAATVGDRARVPPGLAAHCEGSGLHAAGRTPMLSHGPCGGS